jgi:hypothetical protein
VDPEVLAYRDISAAPLDVFEARDLPLRLVVHPITSVSAGRCESSIVPAVKRVALDGLSARWSYSSNVPFFLAVLIFAAIVSACGSGNGGRRVETASSTHTSPAAKSRVEHCVDRLMQHSTEAAVNKRIARRYVRNTYCARFEEEGWVYEDGALRIAAQTWLDSGATCARSGAGEPTRTVPCEPEVRGGFRVVECALLRIVRRSEVSDYIERLRAKGPVQCDDGTAISDLGVP